MEMSLMAKNIMSLEEKWTSVQITIDKEKSTLDCEFVMREY